MRTGGGRSLRFRCGVNHRTKKTLLRDLHRCSSFFRLFFLSLPSFCFPCNLKYCSIHTISNPHNLKHLHTVGRFWEKRSETRICSKCDDDRFSCTALGDLKVHAKKLRVARKMRHTERSKKMRMTSLVGLGCGRVDDESLELRLLRGRQLREHALHLLTETQEEQHRWKQTQQENSVRNKSAVYSRASQLRHSGRAMRCACVLHVLRVWLTAPAA